MLHAVLFVQALSLKMGTVHRRPQLYASIVIFRSNIVRWTSNTPVSLFVPATITVPNLPAARQEAYQKW